MILTIHIDSFKSYAENPSLVLETERPCPECKTRFLSRHGTVGRWVYHLERRERITVFRLRCRPCAFTATLLPDLLVPYKRYAAAVVERSVSNYLAGTGSYRDVSVAITGTVIPEGLAASSLTDALDVLKLKPGFQRVHAWVALVAQCAAADVQAAGAWVTARVPTSTVVDHLTVPLPSLPIRRTHDEGKRADLNAARLLMQIFTAVPELNPTRAGWMAAWLRFVEVVTRRTPRLAPPRSPPLPRTS